MDDGAPGLDEARAAAAPPGAGRRALVVLGHPRGPASLCGALAAAWADGARAAGWTVETADLSAAAFDRDVRQPSPRAQPLEPDLDRLRRAIAAADHLVFVYPTWWGAAPALLKGALDRTLLPGWAFREIEGGTGYEGMLGGRTAEILTTMDTPALVYRWIYGAPGHRAMARATLGFCGVETTRVTRFGPVRGADAATRAAWIARARALGARLAGGPRGLAGRARAEVAPWIEATRLQFHPMAFLAYWAGALVAAEGRPLGLLAFWLGYAAVFLLEAATVYVNDLVDHESDRRNRFWSAFTGGSRVLPAGRLSRRALGRGALVASGLSAAAAAATMAAPGAAAMSWAAVYAALAVLAIGYTAPPLRLSWRGWGEIDVALTHSVGVMLLGAASQGAPATAAAPLLVAGPLGLAVLPSILVAGVPDREADAAVGKRTLAVRLGVRRTLALAAAAAFAAAGAAAAAQAAGAAAMAGVAGPAFAHAALIAVLARREATRGEAARRVDGLMIATLGYVSWFCVIPLVNLA